MAAKNSDVDVLNEKTLDRLEGQEKYYYGAVEAFNDGGCLDERSRTISQRDFRFSSFEVRVLMRCSEILAVESTITSGEHLGRMVSEC